MRKSPIKHHVKTHQRKTHTGTTTVHDHDRGHGERRRTISNPQMHKSQQEKANKYLVHITYSTLPAESFPVSALSYPDAIEIALSSRSHITPPFQIRADKL